MVAIALVQLRGWRKCQTPWNLGLYAGRVLEWILGAAVVLSWKEMKDLWPLGRVWGYRTPQSPPEATESERIGWGL